MDAEWFARLDAECRAGNLTRAYRDALRTLGRLIAMGDDMPSEARIADDAACSKRTVARAKAKARELGLLDWERRFDNAGGLRRERPCLYRAERPTTSVVRRERQPGPRKIQVTDKGLNRSVLAQLAALPTVTPGILALQAARRRRLGLERHL